MRGRADGTRRERDTGRDARVRSGGEARRALDRSLERDLRTYLNLRNHQVILFVLRGVRPQDQLLHAVVLPGGLDTVGEPLHGERGPLERVRHHQVVQKRRVLLPDLVLLRHHALLELVRVFVIVLAHLGDRGRKQSHADLRGGSAPPGVRNDEVTRSRLERQPRGEGTASCVTRGSGVDARATARVFRALPISGSLPRSRFFEKKRPTRLVSAVFSAFRFACILFHDVARARRAPLPSLTLLPPSFTRASLLRLREPRDHGAPLRLVPARPKPGG